MNKIMAKLRQDLHQAISRRETKRRETLRYLLSLLQKEALRQANGQLDEATSQRLLQKELKTKREALAMFRRAKRADLAANEEREIAILEEYLPAAASEAEIRRLIEEIVAGGEKEFGRVMALAMKKLAGRADGHQVANLVREICGS